MTTWIPPKICKTMAQSHSKQPKRPLFYILLGVQVLVLKTCSLFVTGTPRDAPEAKNGNRASRSWTSLWATTRRTDVPCFGHRKGTIDSEQLQHGLWTIYCRLVVLLLFGLGLEDSQISTFRLLKYVVPGIIKNPNTCVLMISVLGP